MKTFWDALKRNAPQIQAMGAIATMCAAVIGLLVIQIQINASARQQREQSARDIYREYVKFAAEKPDLASPDYCAILATPTEVDDIQYDNFLQFQLYMSEQVLEELPGWEGTLDRHLTPHRELLCSDPNGSGESADVRMLLTRFRAKHCTDFKPSCGEAEGDTQ